MVGHASACHPRSEEHTSELQSLRHLVCRLLLEKKKFPSEMRITVGILTCTSSRVCICTAALCFRNFAHGKSARRRSMVFVFFLNRPGPTDTPTFSSPDALPF